MNTLIDKIKSVKPVKPIPAVNSNSFDVILTKSNGYTENSNLSAWRETITNQRVKICAESFSYASERFLLAPQVQIYISGFSSFGLLLLFIIFFNPCWNRFWDLFNY